MPIYEYRCSACEEEFELFQKITDKPGGTCPRCGSTQVKRLVSSTSFTLKGFGWYKDGYASKKQESKKEEKKEEKKEKPKAEKPAEKKKPSSET